MTELTPKAILRQRLLAERLAISQPDWRSKSESICAHLARSAGVQQATTILTYFSTRQEPDLSALWIRYFPNRRWGIPRCVGKTLSWHRWQPTESNQLQLGRYGIMEPVATLPLLTPETVDLILVPAVGCDRHGYRLGYGGGFYDRLFSQPAWADIPSIGIVFDQGYLPQLNPDPWDYPLRAICTESGLDVM